MQSFNEEEEFFFDSLDYIHDSIVSPSLEVPLTGNSGFGFKTFGHEFSTRELLSIRERRNRFFCEIGFSDMLSQLSCSQEQDQSVSGQLGCFREQEQIIHDEPVEHGGLERNTESSHAILDPLSSPDIGGEWHPIDCINDLDTGRNFIIHNLGEDDPSTMVKEDGLGRVLTLQEFEGVLGLSHTVQRFLWRGAALPVEKRDKGLNANKAETKSCWRKKFVSKKNAVQLHKNVASLKSLESLGMIRTKVKHCRKSGMEISVLYMGQEIIAHKGVIRTMKFSQSGMHLASGGVDCVVRVWQVREDEVSGKCLTIEGSSEVVDIDKEGRLRLAMKSFSSAPVVIPHKVFKIEEKPVHEFCGHTSDILDLSWSKSDCLLSSSNDKTVRMWKVGCQSCLRIFHHYDYVTCVQFNPVDEGFFISGSLDGKVRIWRVDENHVVNWADLRNIVTAVCYHPHGKRFAVGLITGNCRFYVHSGNSLELDTQFYVQGKKKRAGKQITGLQFYPGDSQRVMITTTDSKIRIYNGFDVIDKFKDGCWKSRSQLSASFSSDGKYVVSVGENSHVYIWDYNSSGIPPPTGAKVVHSSEHFFSKGVLLAVPWPGMDQRLACLSNSPHSSSPLQQTSEVVTWLRDQDCFSLSSCFCADGPPRSTSTWPEENLPQSQEPQIPVDRRRFRRHHHQQQQQCHLPHRYQGPTSLSATPCPVIVTASCDGIIRTFHNYSLPVRLQ